MEDQNPLDSISIETESNYELAPTWKRLVNFIIDYLMMLIIVVGFILMRPTFLNDDSTLKMYLIIYIVFFLYYSIMEGIFGRTIGKFITGTTVVRSADLEKITFSQAMGRSVSRFVPFEPFSLLGSLTGWHDDWANTMVVNTKNLVRGNNI